MATGEAYREYAAQCVRLAQQKQKPTEKAILLEMADIWIRLAEKAELDAKHRESSHNPNK
jgi:hypothetical protein